MDNRVNTTCRTGGRRLLFSLIAGLFFLLSTDGVTADETSRVAALSPAGCGGEGPAVKVTVDNLLHAKGLVTADLHDDTPENFLKRGKKLARVRVPAEKGQVTFCVPVPKPGIYAIGVYHDENGNKRFDKNFLGIPVEPFGISNNPTIVFSKPSIEDSTFDVGENGAEITISVSAWGKGSEN